jgi:uncharacterized protein involved in exopolysaccharide biosynthesis
MVNNKNFNDSSFEQNEEYTFKEFILSIKNIFSFLKRNVKTLFFVSVFGMLLGLIYSIFEKPDYKAVLTFAMEEDKSSGSMGGLSGALGLASSFGIDLGSSAGSGGAFAATNLAALMKSHLIIEKVLLDSYVINNKQTTLVDYYIKIKRYKNKWKKKQNLTNLKFPVGLDRSKFTIQQDSILHELYKELTITENLDIRQQDKKVTIVTIQVKSTDEIFSKLFCEGLANKTSDLYVQHKSKKARLNTEVLQKQADSVRNILYKNISGVAKETDNIYNLNPSYNIKGASSKKIQIDVTANTEVLKQLVIQLELSKITLRTETPLIQLIDKPKFPLEINKFGVINSMILGAILFFLFAIVYLFIYDKYKKLNI